MYNLMTFKDLTYLLNTVNGKIHLDRYNFLRLTVGHVLGPEPGLFQYNEAEA